MWFNDFSPKVSCTRSNICARYVEYQKAKNGEKLIEPEMQKQLLAIFKEKGADMSIGFDSYEEKVVLVRR